MYLKSLTLRGFKSFASATKLDLEPGITCVVGPNGSGKSNVVDALAWVMGEQGAKNLRGGKMDDVIFAGTSGRGPLGRAEVALTIDNTDGAIPIDYTEVTIKRTLFRTGGSEYSVNGEPARLLDIQELLNDSGLGKEMHVIVGQGRLDQILQADPLERRGFIEEAAGVLKHRRRKDKALRKLDGLQTNLDRLNDLRTELSRQLGPLSRQAKAARRAAVVQATVRDASARLLADDVVRVQARLEAASGPVDGGQRRRSLEARIAEIDTRISGIEQELHAQGARTEELQQHLRLAGTRAAGAAALSRRASDRVTHLRTVHPETTGKDAPETLRSRADSFEKDLAAARTALEESGKRLAEAQESRTALAAELEAEENALKAARIAIAARLKERAGLASAREVAAKTLQDAADALASLDTRETALGEQLTAARTDLEAAQAAAAEVESGETALDAAHESALAALTALEEKDEVLAGSLTEHSRELDRARARVEALRVGTRLAAATEDLLAAGHRGVRAAVGDLLDIVPGHEVAVTSALGALASAVLVDDVDAAAAVLAALPADTAVDLAVAGGATPTRGAASEPRDAAAGPASPEGTADEAVATTVDGGFRAGARLGDLVTSPDPGLTELLDRVFADVRTVEDVAAGARLVTDEPGLIAVTAAGEILSASRVSRGDSAEAGRIESRAALARTEAHIVELEREHAELLRQREEGRPALEAARAEVDRALTALHESDSRILAAGEELSRAAEAVRRIEEQLADIAARRTRIRAEREEAARALDRAEAALRSNTDEVDTEPDTHARDALAARVRTLSDELVELRIAHRGAEDRVTFLQDRIASLRRQAEQEEQARARAARIAARRRKQAAAAEHIAEIASGLATHLGVLEARAEESLTGLRERRAVLEEELGRVRSERAEHADALGALTNAEHEARLARERHVLRLEELERRARGEVGLSLEHLVEQFGPHLEVPEYDAEGAATESEGDDGNAPEDDGDGASVASAGDEPTASTDRQAPPTRPYVRAEVEKAKAKAERALKAIGTVNPLALEEYTALRERHDFLHQQIDDIETSRKDLRGLVKEVDSHVKQVFEEAFADTAREFEHIFSRLFPGGEGRLTLTDPEDMLTTGVDVHARPAGKRVKRLSLLSGGERSLVAIALLVAIFKARPSPFYVMDEVEAALDDLNLSRLLTVFRELQETSQLIVITHQKRTMEIADALYGVAMGGDGVSAVISQRIHRVGSGT
ncbi:chromosome segregation protein SMC [Brevibacterium samyangense]|uniref:Chromosome partition protein Smc n=1 Tax=Brevibacterium samyangense TaxID=366888 RepID=A0ABN2TCL3_9MICO